MKASSLKSEVLSAFLIGTARRRPDYPRVVGNALPANDVKADLKAAALLAQALRLERPASPEAFTVEPASAARRRMLPEELRDSFVRLFGADKSALPPQDDLAFGMATALEQLFLAPHPYDFHRLDGFLRAHADRLGADVLAWVDRDKSTEERQSYFDLAVLTDDNWTEATPSRRERYIEDRRRADPAAARALVEAVWDKEAAEIRLRLLGALRIRLGPEDRPFLEGLAKDRAPKVRELAATFLARLPGQDGVRQAHREALSRITKETTGFFRKKTVLKLEAPATTSKDAWINWVFMDFADIAVETCLTGLGMTAKDALEAAREDIPLLAALTMMAAQSRRFDVVSELAEMSNLPIIILAAGGFARGQDFAPAESLALAEAIFRAGPKLKTATFSAVVHQLYVLTRTTITSTAFDAVAGEAERRWVEGNVNESQAMLTPLALLAPASRRNVVRSLAQRLGDAGDPVIAWLDLLDSLEKVSTHE